MSVRGCYRGGISGYPLFLITGGIVTDRLKPSVLFVVSLLIIVSLVVSGSYSPAFCDEEPKRSDSSLRDGEAKSESVQEKWGIEVVFLRLSAAGRIIDFRYRVTDPEKAIAVFDGRVKPVVIDKASGKRMSVVSVAKAGALRQKTLSPEKGRIYFILFKNEGGLMKVGSKADVEVGEIIIPGLLVE